MLRRLREIPEVQEAFEVRSRVPQQMHQHVAVGAEALPHVQRGCLNCQQQYSLLNQHLQYYNKKEVFTSKLAKLD